VSIFRGKTPEERFWHWFKAHSKRLDLFKAPDLMNELLSELQKVHPALTYSLGPCEQGKREITISANDMESAVPTVQKLIATAPNMPGWKISAFLPRRPLLQGVLFGKRKLEPDDIWFAAEPEGEKLSLTVYIKDLTNPVGEIEKTAAFLWLRFSLGEHDVITKIGNVELATLPENPEASGLRPAKDLPGIVDQFHER